MRLLSLSCALSVGSLFLVGWSPSTSVEAFVPQTPKTTQRQSTIYSQQSSSPIVLFESPNGAEIEDKQETTTPPTASSTSTSAAVSSSSQSVSSKHGTEKQLREEIAERNSIVANEEKYAILDGTGMASTAIPKEDEETEEDTKGKEDAPVAVVNKSEIKSETTSETVSDAVESTALQKKLDRLIKQRPYGLFIAEKAFEIVEDIAEDVFGIGERSSINSQKRERIVVLGTGWGAAAFLKGIDTRLYDVTVISPRNYFVFTPMLAGASVGTVDYRSITEPIREVRYKMARM
jgi:hypothetical protein